MRQNFRVLQHFLKARWLQAFLSFKTKEDGVSSFEIVASQIDERGEVEGTDSDFEWAIGSTQSQINGKNDHKKNSSQVKFL